MALSNFNGEYAFLLEDVNIFFKNNKWKLKDQANAIKYLPSKEELRLDAVQLYTGNQQVELGGFISKKDKSLKLSFKDLDLADVMVPIDSLSFGGKMNGDFYLKQSNGSYQPQSDIEIEDFAINKINQGKLKANLNSTNSLTKYDVSFLMDNAQSKRFKAEGELDLTNKIPVVDLDIELEDYELKAFSPLGKNILNKIEGSVSGTLNLLGIVNNPSINGHVSLKDASLNIPYLNTHFDIENASKVVFENNSMIFSELKAIDRKHKTTGLLSGEITHRTLSNWDLDLNISTDRMLVLDRPKDVNSLFYGTGFASGTARIHGEVDQLNIDINAKTMSPTNFILPLKDKEELEKNNFIFFKENQKGKEKAQAKFDNNDGVTVNMNLEVTPSATAEIVIDAVSGSSISGRGNGDLTFEMNPLGEIDLFGTYTISSGEYRLKYGGVINKPFVVNKGSTINWDGNPYEADLNVKAIHSVKANPKDLLENLNFSRKIDVDLITQIDGKILQTKESFDIKMPNVSPLLASELDFKLNDNDENLKMQQFFLFLVTKRFFNEENLDQTGNAAITGTTSELISNTLSNVINNGGDKFQIGFGYTAGERNQIDAPQIDDQVDISLETQINDRILINGKLGVPVGESTESDIVGEVKIEFLLDESGQLRWSLFNRQNEIQYTLEEEGYTQGVGLSYQLNFDKVKEIFKKNKKEKKNIKETVSK